MLINKLMGSFHRLVGAHGHITDQPLHSLPHYFLKEYRRAQRTWPANWQSIEKEREAAPEVTHRLKLPGREFRCAYMHAQWKVAHHAALMGCGWSTGSPARGLSTRVGCVPNPSG